MGPAKPAGSFSTTSEWGGRGNPSEGPWFELRGSSSSLVGGEVKGGNTPGAWLFL